MAGAFLSGSRGRIVQLAQLVVQQLFEFVEQFFLEQLVTVIVEQLRIFVVEFVVQQLIEQQLIKSEQFFFQQLIGGGLNYACVK